MQKSCLTDRPLDFSMIGITTSSVVPGGTLGLREIMSPFFRPIPIEVATEQTVDKLADMFLLRTGTHIILKYDLRDAAIGSLETSKRPVFNPSAYASAIPGSGIKIRPFVAAVNTSEEVSTPITWHPALNHAAARGAPTWPNPYIAILRLPSMNFSISL